MAFDGITIANIVKELNDTLVGGRLYKIAQPEGDELLITVKGNSATRKLFLSAEASLPLIYLTESNKPSPMTAPNFCMLLRKHLSNGRIVSITQPGLERIVHINVEHLDEMGDLRHKTLVMELMGKHSNIIFVNDDNTIIDSIKHVSAAISSVREVLPGKPYYVPEIQDKKDPLEYFAAADPSDTSESVATSHHAPQGSLSDFRECMIGKAQPVYKAIYGTFTGLSPIIAQELCHEAGIDGDISTAALAEEDLAKLFICITELMNRVRRGEFAPTVAYTTKGNSGKVPVEFAAIPLTMYNGGDDSQESFASMSALLESYYAQKNAVSRIRQKSSDLRRIVTTALERDIKKYDLQLKQIRDTEKREQYRIYGELLNTYGYSAKPGDQSLTCLNYYTNEEITIPLDPTLTAKEQAQKYFDRYNKLKRTFEALSTLTEEVKSEIDHLESISTALDIALREDDLVQIREELTEAGYIRRKGPSKKVKITSKPLHYISSDGFHIYVGKNNLQNDELTFKFATGGDWWFHAKKIPGSHVVLKVCNVTDIPDRAFEEAARLAAYYSKGREQDKVEIDYVRRKEVKKPAGSKPGFVVYYTNFSMAIDSNIAGLQLVEK